MNWKMCMTILVDIFYRNKLNLSLFGLILEISKSRSTGFLEASKGVCKEWSRLNFFYFGNAYVTWITNEKLLKLETTKV